MDWYTDKLVSGPRWGIRFSPLTGIRWIGTISPVGMVLDTNMRSGFSPLTGIRWIGTVQPHPSVVR